MWNIESVKENRNRGLWNELIFRKYNNLVKIDKDRLKMNNRKYQIKKDMSTICLNIFV